MLAFALAALECGGRAERLDSHGAAGCGGVAASATSNISTGGADGASGDGGSSVDGVDSGLGGASNTATGESPPSCLDEPIYDSCFSAFWEIDPNDRCALLLPVLREGSVLDLNLLAVSLCTEGSLEPLRYVPDASECQDGAWYYPDPPDAIRLCESTCELTEDPDVSALALTACGGPDGVK